MSGLRFCMVTTFYPPYSFGGDGIGVQRLSRALVRRGHAVTVVHDQDAYRLLARNGARGAAPAVDDGVEVLGLGSRLGRLSPLLAQQTGQPAVHGDRLRELLAPGRFDVIHFHNVSLMGGPGILSLGRAVKLYTAHEHWLVCPTHVLWRFDREPCPGRACTRCVLKARRPPQLWRATAHLERHSKAIDAFIALSEFSREKHRQMGFRRKMEVIPPFLPDDEPGSTGPGALAEKSPRDRPYFLYLGRLERIKGVADLITAFRGYPDADLLVAGDGALSSELRQAAADLPHVHFLGRLDTQVLQRYLRHAIALLVPSTGYETFGQVIIEAFRVSTPVIARRIGPFPEIVEASGGGMLFDDHAGLRAEMRRFQRDVGLRAACAAAGRAAYLRYWSEQSVLPRYLALVEHVAVSRETARTSGDRPATGPS